MTLGLTPSSEETPERMAKRAAMNQEILEVLQAKLAENPSLNLDHEIPRLQLDAKRKYFPHPTALLLQQRQKPPQPKPQGFPASLLKSSAKPVILRPLSAKAMALIFENINEKEETGKTVITTRKKRKRRKNRRRKKKRRKKKTNSTKVFADCSRTARLLPSPLAAEGSCDAATSPSRWFRLEPSDPSTLPWNTSLTMPPTSRRPSRTISSDSVTLGWS
jgi:hypothetical protein